MPKDDAHEVHREPLAAIILAEVDLGLLAGRRGAHDIVPAAPVRGLLDGAGPLEVVDEVAQSLLVARKRRVLAALHEHLDEDVVDRAHVAAWVGGDDVYDGAPERLGVEGHALAHLRMVVVRRAVHVVVLAHRLLAWHLGVPAPELRVWLGERIPRSLELLYLPDHLVLYHLVAPYGRVFGRTMTVRMPDEPSLP